MGECGDRLRRVTPVEWRWIKLVGFMLLIILLTGLLYGYRDTIFDAIRSAATWMRAAGFGGVVLMLGWAFLTSFPPVPLRETGMRLTGYVWGVPWGFLIAFSGSLVGSILCFLVGRYLFHARVLKWIAGDKHLTAIRQSLALGGLKLILLLRIGPFPFSWMSLFLSATDISLQTYLWATLAGLQWVWYQVWIGTVLDNVEAASNLDFSADSTKVNIGVALASTVLSLLAMYFIKKEVDSILQKSAARDAEATNEDGLTSFADSDPAFQPTELDMPEGFARRFTPPSHALWAAHMRPKPEDEKKEEVKGQPNRGESAGEEMVSIADATAGFVSGPLVDLEMIHKVVTSVRKASQETDRRKTLTEKAPEEENKGEARRASRDNPERGSRAQTTIAKKTPETPREVQNERALRGQTMVTPRKAPETPRENERASRGQTMANPITVPITTPKQAFETPSEIQNERGSRGQTISTSKQAPETPREAQNERGSRGQTTATPKQAPETPRENERGSRGQTISTFKVPETLEEAQNERGSRGQTMATPKQAPLEERTRGKTAPNLN